MLAAVEMMVGTNHTQLSSFANLLSFMTSYVSTVVTVKNSEMY